MDAVILCSVRYRHLCTVVYRHRNSDRQSGWNPRSECESKGGTAGTITNMDGQFTLSVPSSKSILVVSYIGYTPQEVAINGKNKLDIHLLEDTKTLDEVVVVGYGVQKKSHLTGSVSKMDINNLTDIPVTQVDQLLQGKIAGVNIQNSTSEAGAARKSVCVVWVLSVPTVLR